MHTRVVFEMDKETPESRAVLSSLGMSLKKYCPGLEVTVFPRYTGLENCRIADGVVHTAHTAESEIAEHPDAELCIYLSPRTIVIAKRPVASTIFIIRDRSKLLAARIQVMHEEEIRPFVQHALHPEMEIAKKRLFGEHRPSEADENSRKRFPKQSATDTCRHMHFCIGLPEMHSPIVS